MTLNDLKSLAYNPKAVNHPVTLCDGSVVWMRMSAREKNFYKRRYEAMISDYATFLNEEGV